jgi:chaperonin GroES
MPGTREAPRLLQAGTRLERCTFSRDLHSISRGAGSSVRRSWSSIMAEAKMSIETIEPVGLRVLIRKDEERRTTRGGIHLPDDAKTPVLSGRIVAISAQVDSDPDYPLQKYDKVLIDPRNGIPVDFEQDNKLFIIPIEDVVAVFRKEDPKD